MAHDLTNWVVIILKVPENKPVCVVISLTCSIIVLYIWHIRGLRMNIDTENKWVMLNRETGQEIECDVFLESRSSHHWERTCIGTLAAFIECGGSASTDIISYILKNKDSTNRIIGSYDKIAAEVDVGKSSVKRVITAMIKKGLMRKEQNGVYIIHGDVARYGSRSKGAAIAAIWEESKGTA